MARRDHTWLLRAGAAALLVGCCMGIGPTEARADTVLDAQLDACLRAVMEMSTAPLDGWEASFAMDEERDGLPNVRRVIEPDEGASEILFAISPVYFDAGTFAGADCHMTVAPDDDEAIAGLEAFRVALADRFGPFEPIANEYALIEEQACVDGRPLRLIGGEPSANGEAATRIALWNSSREGVEC